MAARKDALFLNNLIKNTKMIYKVEKKVKTEISLPEFPFFVKIQEKYIGDEFFGFYSENEGIRILESGFVSNVTIRVLCEEIENSEYSEIDCITFNDVLKTTLNKFAKTAGIDEPLVNSDELLTYVNEIADNENNNGFLESCSQVSNKILKMRKNEG